MDEIRNLLNELAKKQRPFEREMYGLWDRR